MSKHQVEKNDVFLYVKATATETVPIGFGRTEEGTHSDHDFSDVINLTPEEAEEFADWLRTYAREARHNREY